MVKFSRELRFEDAQILKEKIEILAKFRSRSAVVSNIIKNVDVFAFAQDDDRCFVNYLKVVEGAVVQAFTLEMRSRVDEEKTSLLGFAITEIRQRYSSDSPEIIVPFRPDIELNKIKYTVPKIGESSLRSRQTPGYPEAGCPAVPRSTGEFSGMLP